MQKCRSVISVIAFAMFVISAVSGLIMFFMPHQPHGGPEAAQAVKGAVENSGISFMLIVKKSHEYLSVVMTLVLTAHIWLNWKCLKSYILK